MIVRLAPVSRPAFVGCRWQSGDVKPVGSDISEMRIDYGPGYRVYFVRRRGVVVVLLCGGDKRTQTRDISRAIELARDL